MSVFSQNKVLTIIRVRLKHVSKIRNLYSILVMHMHFRSFGSERSMKLLLGYNVKFSLAFLNNFNCVSSVYGGPTNEDI